MSRSPILVESPDELELRHCVICIGNFDGVHLGHQMLLDHMRELAQAQELPSVVITFFPPAKLVFQGGSYLTGREEKIALLRPFAPTAVVVVPFDLRYAKTDKQVFLAQLERLEPHTIIVGEDFRFGHNRAGGLDDLQHVTERLEVYGMKRWAGRPVKSSRIRELLAAGRVREMRELLGHPYIAMGKVTEGAKRGRTIGFPTANLDLSPEKALPLGVFAVWAETAAGRFGGMANVGPRPSFEEAPPALEVHLFDFDGDLYGQTVTVSFEAFLRSQRKFSGLDELKSQLELDKRAAREKLGLA